MAWLWDTFEEYVGWVHPLYVDNEGLFDHAARETAGQREASLNRARTEAHSFFEGLERLLRDHPEDAETPVEAARKAERLAALLIHNCEELLLYHRRLAKSDHAYGFLSQNDIPEHLERYGPQRSMYEIRKLAKDVDELFKGLHKLETEDENLFNDLNLPKAEEADFRTARDLFSLGLDEGGVLLAARGFEGVLRAVAARRKLMILTKGITSIASDADLRDLIELFYHVTWKHNGERVITRELRALLHYLREIRNAGAHANGKREAAMLLPRQVALLLATNAAALWHRVTGSKARFAATTIQHAW